MNPYASGSLNMPVSLLEIHFHLFVWLAPLPPPVSVQWCQPDAHHEPSWITPNWDHQPWFLSYWNIYPTFISFSVTFSTIFSVGKKLIFGVLWWPSWLRIWHGHCCGSGLIPGPESILHATGVAKTKQKTLIFFTHHPIFRALNSIWHTFVYI